ncbi:rab effector MyRIP isoform X2 [Heterocephalus glaber]|uniref:Rab effector MyRIP isoform X2 n=1 Tax=Heterocephalus glaber TaxID=10181 RepID=A0AAX6SWK3_HETGA|nr:rab effector MyRIP isoform X2 [Heterocephalus glaber]
MGRKLDLSGLTDEETEHVLQVVQRDFNLRKKEEERLSEMKQKLEEEGSKCSILAKHQKFVEHCCMRCCAPFTFLLNTRRHCSDCKFNVCKGCCSFLRHEKAWVCCVCQQARLLRTQSLEWFYSNVKSRFKRFGSAKVLKNLYRKHRLETGASFDVLGTGFFESHLENDGSISGSDSSFPWQPEGHSMMDTLAVALRVAEEAIEEAICKAEAHGDSLDKQKEAAYLQDHREELAEELAATILQKIIRKQKRRSKQHMEEDPEGPQPPGCSLKAKDEGSAAAPGDHSVPTTLWRSQSAFSFPGGDTRKTSALEAAARWCPGQPCALPSWKSVDGLDGTSAAPVLQSPDGNWVALKDSVAPPAHLLAARKSTTLQALEVPPRAASAYQELGSDSEEDFDWNAALSKLCLQAQGADHGAPATSPSLGASPNPEAMGSDSETSSAGSSRDAGRRARFSWPPRRGPRNPAAERLRLQGELDVNFNPQAASAETSDSSEPEEAPQAADWRARQWRRAHLNPKELGTEQCGPHTCTQELHTHQGPSDLSETDISNEAADSRSSTDTAEEKRRAQLYELAMKMSEKETSSGEDPESEPKTGPENQESLSSEENAQSVQDELRKVYLAAGTVYGLEGQLAALEDAACSIHSGTQDTELAELEDQVAEAAAQVHHAELQISDIESRISALTIAGLNIAPCMRLTRKQEQRRRSQVQTIDTSRQQRRKLPAPPVKAGKTEASSVTTIKTFHSNFILQGSSISRPTESGTQDLTCWTGLARWLRGCSVSPAGASPGVCCDVLVLLSTLPVTHCPAHTTVPSPTPQARMSPPGEAQEAAVTVKQGCDPSPEGHRGPTALPTRLRLGATPAAALASSGSSLPEGPRHCLLRSCVVSKIFFPWPFGSVDVCVHDCPVESCWREGGRHCPFSAVLTDLPQTSLSNECQGR